MTVDSKVSGWLIGYPWHDAKRVQSVWLTAAVCYDATDLGLASDLRDESDILAIPALNKDIKTACAVCPNDSGELKPNPACRPMVHGRASSKSISPWKSFTRATFTVTGSPMRKLRPWFWPLMRWAVS